MKIETIKTSDVKPYETNAKKHPTTQVKQIAASIQRFGFLQPLVLDKDNNCVVGHGRLLAAELLQLQSVPVLRVENLSKDEIRAYRIADNKLNESTWDMDLVMEELEDLDEELAGLTGFAVVSTDEFGEGFSLPDGEKSPFQQITFTLADKQADIIKAALVEARKEEGFEYCETMKNENSNGNALYYIITQWVEQKK